MNGPLAGAAGPDRPLLGRSVVVTRSVAQASDLADALAAYGAEVLEFPTIAIAEPEDWAPADAAVAGLGGYDWVVLTSANAVQRFADRVMRLGGDEHSFGGVRIAAVGPATAAACAARGLRVDLVPEEYRAEGALQELVDAGVGQGSRVLVPRALEAREVLPDTLRSLGATVDVVPVYRTVRGEGAPGVLERMTEGTVDAVTFTSSSTVRNFAALAAPLDTAELLKDVVVASIGPVTSQTARGLGLEVSVEPADSTVPALAAALADHFRRGDGPGGLREAAK